MPKNDSEKAKRKRFEGFIHQKIDLNTEKALTLLSQLWKIPVEDVPRRAIQETATQEALSEGVSQLKKVPEKKISRKASSTATADVEMHQKTTLEKDRIAAELKDLRIKFEATQSRVERLKKLLSEATKILDE